MIIGDGIGNHLIKTTIMIFQIPRAVIGQIGKMTIGDTIKMIKDGAGIV